MITNILLTFVFCNRGESSDRWISSYDPGVYITVKTGNPSKPQTRFIIVTLNVESTSFGLFYYFIFYPS